MSTTEATTSTITQTFALVVNTSVPGQDDKTVVLEQVSIEHRKEVLYRCESCDDSYRLDQLQKDTYSYVCQECESERDESSSSRTRIYPECPECTYENDDGEDVNVEMTLVNDHGNTGGYEPLVVCPNCTGGPMTRLEGEDRVTFCADCDETLDEDDLSDHILNTHFSEYL